jgi:HKD family nuclease
MSNNIIPNIGPATLRVEIEESLQWATHVDLASAFITEEVLRILSAALNQAKRARRPLHIRLITGLYQRFTPPAALKLAAKLESEFQGSFFVKIAKNERFHWKAYLFRSRGQCRLYVGSANLTADGMMASGELTLRVDARTRDGVATAFQEQFDHLWRREAFSITDTFLADYSKVKRPATPRLQTAADKAIAGLLERAHRTHAVKTGDILGKGKPYLISLEGVFSKTTERILSECTTWYEDKTLVEPCSLTSVVRERAYQAQVVVEAWKNKRQWMVALAIPADKIDKNTPDGKYFLVYRKIPGSKRMKYAGGLRDRLVEAGLTQDELKRNHEVTPRQLAVLAQRLHATDWLLAHGVKL